MNPARIAMIFFLFLVCSGAAGQSFNSGKNRRPFRGLRSEYPHHGIGVKLGDPLAITYKFYGSEKFSFAIDFGTASSGLYNRYYRQTFSTYIKSDTFMTSDASISYSGHKVKSDLLGEIKFLYHLDAKMISPGFKIYFGAGWQFKDTRIEFTYVYNNATVENSPGKFTRQRLTMGPQLVTGAEYSIKNIPVAAFLEVEYYTDIQIDPGWHRFEGGVGLRYQF